MRISLDFEGVLAQAWSDDELAGLDRETLKRSALSVASERRRFGARSVVSLLGAFASIEIVTVRPPSAAPAIRAWLREHLPGLEGAAIHSCAAEGRATFVRENGYALHLDHLAPEGRAPGGEAPDGEPAEGAAGRWLVWERQSLEELLRQLAAALGRCPDLRFGGRAVTGLAELPSFSSTPVYRVETAAGVFKLRLVEHARQSALLARLHQLAAESPALADLLPPQLPGLPAFVHAIPFLAGQMVEVRAPADGTALVERAARWQAALHAQTLREDGTCLVSCACDAFNLCVADDGAAGIVDAADCLLAPRWVDLIWTERLLCPWTGGAERFFETYFAATSARPTHDDVAEALAGYYHWHQTIIRDSLRRRAADPAVTAMLRQVKAWRAATPDATLLSRYTA